MAGDTPEIAQSRETFVGSLKAYLAPRPLIMLALGFSAGLPFLLSGNTLGYWLREEGTSLQAIGFLAWVGLAYSFKMLWAPMVDRLDAPIFGGWLGRRRGWMLLAQLLIAIGLMAMAIFGASHGLILIAVFAVVVAFSSATQDIVIDAWRIEAARDSRELGVLSASYQLGYRAALLVTDALILITASSMGWPLSYVLMAVLMGVGLAATFFAPEPARHVDDPDAPQALPLSSLRGLYDAIVGPFVVFFKSHGTTALLMLLFITLYRLPDFMMGPMAGPFYHDLGLEKETVGEIRASIGLLFSLAGIAVGGFCAQRFGLMRTLLAGALLQGGAVASFALLSWYGADLALFAPIMAVDSFATSFAGVALVTYMSGLTSIGYTATQYALLSSAYAYAGKTLKGFSGVVIERLSDTYTLMDAYAIFFIGAGAIGIPAIVLIFVLVHVNNRKRAATVPVN